MISQLVLGSRYMLVTTEEQAVVLLGEAKAKPESLKGLLVIMDSNLVTSGRHAYKLTVALIYLICQSRKLGVAFLILKNAHIKLDKRIERQLTHSSRVMSEEWPKEFPL